MTYFITALTNDRARLIVSESRTTDETLASLLVSTLQAQGYVVLLRAEG